VNELLKLIKKVTGVAVTEQTPLLSSALIDSFKFSELVMLLEEKHQVSIDAANVGIDNFDTPAQIDAYLTSLRA
jgi:acyl carrier protein